VLFDVNCARGRQQSERWTWVPTAADIGSHPFELIVRDENNRRVVSASCTIDVVATNRGAAQPMTLLMIGDSLTHASVYPQRVVHLCENTGGPQLTLIGSHIPEPSGPTMRHEGYGGWTAKRFATHYAETARTGEYAKRGSPFLYQAGNEPPRLDFAAYCQDVNAGGFPDIVSIFLGPNDIFSFDDETIDTGIDDILKHMDSLVTMIGDASPATRIALLLPVPPAASQDAFGANYANGQTRWQYRRNQHRLVERLMDRYANSAAEPVTARQVRLIPTHVCLDCVNNYPTEAVSPNALSDLKIVRQNNGVHPAASGYNQIGDMLFAWLKGQTKETAH
jgi:lysophospholipase L1-like esterase